MAGEEANEAPAVELGTGASVGGTSLAHVASRLTWLQEKSSILNKKGDAVVRTPDGPQSLEDVFVEADETYFDTRQAFIDDVSDIVNHDSIQTD